MAEKFLGEGSFEGDKEYHLVLTKEHAETLKKLLIHAKYGEMPGDELRIFATDVIQFMQNNKWVK